MTVYSNGIMNLEKHNNRLRAGTYNKSNHLNNILSTSPMLFENPNFVRVNLGQSRIKIYYTHSVDSRLHNNRMQHAYCGFRNANF